MPGPLRSWIAPGVLAVLVVGLLGASAVIRSHHGRETDAGMLVAAQVEARNSFSLDYRHAEKDVDEVLALATGKFKREYAARSKALVDGVTKKKVVISATIPEDGAAVELVNGDHGQVLVAVDVSSGPVGGATRQDRLSTRIFLTKVGGRWLVSDLKQVG